MGQFLPHTPTNQLGHDPLKHRVLLFLSLSLTYLFCIFSFDFAVLAEIFRRFVRDPAQRTQLLFAFASWFRQGHLLVGGSTTAVATLIQLRLS